MPYNSAEEAQQAIDKIIADGGPSSFEGHNCDEWNDQVCLGWDGQSRRCDCGNRRVYWDISEHDGKWYFEAVAY